MGSFENIDAIYGGNFKQTRIVDKVSVGLPFCVNKI